MPQPRQLGDVAPPKSVTKAGGHISQTRASRLSSNVRSGKIGAASNMKPPHPRVNKVLLGLNSLEIKFSRANRVAGVPRRGEGQAYDFTCYATTAR